MLSDPLQCPARGCVNFEVEVYNKEVRALLKENRHHRAIADRWADGIRQVVEARDAADARAKVERRYPPEHGYVVAGIVRLAGGRRRDG